MRRGKGEPFIILNWRRFLHAFLVFVFVFVLFISFEGPELLNWSSFSDEDPELYEARRSSIAQKDSRNPRFQDSRDRFSNSANTLGNNSPFISSSHEALRARHTWKHSSDRNSIREYGRIPRQIREMQNGTRFVSALEKMASDAWQVGLHLWTDMHHNKSNAQNHSSRGIMRDSCPHSIFLSEKYLQKNGMMARLPCGLMLGSSITVVGTPLPGHVERLVKAYRSRHGPLIAIVSQFIVELEGQKIYDTEDPPRILHVNPRLKGDWSGKSIFEVNTCYRGQWGTAQRCNGVESQHDDTGGSRSTK